MRYDQAAVVIGRLAIGNSAKSLCELPRISGVTEDGQLFLEEKPLHWHLGDQSLDLYLAAPNTPPPEALRDIAGYRVLLKGALPKLKGDSAQTQGLSDSWRGLWRMVNYLQDLPGFHLEFEGVAGAGAPVISAEPPGMEAEAWTEVEALVDEGFASIIEALKAAGVPPPDLVGWDAVQGDAVVGMVEIGWSLARVGLVEAAFELPGWHIIVVDTSQRVSNMDLVDMILSRVERSTA